MYIFVSLFLICKRTGLYRQCYRSASSQVPEQNKSISVWEGRPMTQTRTSNVFLLSDTTVVAHISLAVV